MTRPAAHSFGHFQALKISQPHSTKPINDITVVIPTINTSPFLHTVIQGWQWQTVPANILIVDTGSTLSQYDSLEHRLNEPPQTNVMRVGPRAWKHLSARVAAAIDAAIAIVETPLVVLTHDDVLLQKPTVLEELIADHKSVGNIATGYEISPRSHITEQWRGMLSHTLTMLDVKAVRRRNLRWSLQDAFDNPEIDNKGEGWPDTETAFGLAIKQQMLDVTFIGHETNEQHFEDERICHRRSLTSHRLLWPKLAQRDLDWQASTIERFERLYRGH